MVLEAVEKARAVRRLGLEAESDAGCRCDDDVNASRTRENRTRAAFVISAQVYWFACCTTCGYPDVTHS
jgi:hypothetical protein